LISFQIIILITLFILPEQNHLYGKEKSSQEIQKDIDEHKTELQSLRDEIKHIENSLHQKNQEAIFSTEFLINLENKITLTEKLIRSLNREERYINNLIDVAEGKIEELEKLLTKLKKQLIKRLQYIYIYGRKTILETIITSKNWNSAIYRIKYLNILAEYEQNLRQDMKEVLIKLENEKQQLIIEKKHKTKLLKEKEKEGSNLENDKIKRELILKTIKKDKNQLEKDRSVKTNIINKMEKLIKKLYSDKDAMKKREEELARQRAKQNNEITGNFTKMKGKLPWPVNGTIVSKFGLEKDSKTGVIIENVGINIAVGNNNEVKSVLDGVISTITYIRGHGKVIIIDHGEGFSTVYAKVDNIKINENEYVQMGTTIATISKENQRTAELHFEVWGNQKKLDPQIWLKP